MSIPDLTESIEVDSGCADCRVFECDGETFCETFINLCEIEPGKLVERRSSDEMLELIPILHINSIKKRQSKKLKHMAGISVIFLTLGGGISVFINSSLIDLPGVYLGLIVIVAITRYLSTIRKSSQVKSNFSDLILSGISILTLFICAMSFVSQGSPNRVFDSPIALGRSDVTVLTRFRGIYSNRKTKTGSGRDYKPSFRKGSKEWRWEGVFGEDYLKAIGFK